MTGRVLIFGEDKSLLEICSLILSSIQLQVFSKNNCRTILEDVKRTVPDVIVIDSHNITEGISAVQQIKSSAEFRDIPVIFLSIYNKLESLTNKAGIDYCLEKPFNLKDLEDRVIRAIGV